MKYLSIFLMIITLSLFAQTKSEKNDTDIKFHSQSFFNYVYTKNSQGFNDQNNRFYFGFKKKLNDVFCTRFTLDVGKEKTAMGSFRYGAFMKYGYFKAKINKDLSLTAGIFLNPVHGFSNKFWGHRYIVSAYGGKYWNAVPQGLMLNYKVSDMIKLAFLLTNGSTYKFVGDNDKNKDFAFVLQASPVKGLDVVWHGRYIIPIEDNAESKNFMSTFFTGYSTDLFKIGYQLLFAMNGDKKSMGHVLYSRVMPTKETEVFSSFKFNKKDIDESNKKLSLILGGEYKYTKDIKFALSYENIWTSDFKDGNYTVRISSFINFK